MTDQLPNYCYVDTETTGLHPDNHEIWEVGLIYPAKDMVGRDGWSWYEKEWQLPVNLANADPFALKIGNFHYRRKADRMLNNVGLFCGEFAKLTRDLHIIGACISFDAERLGKLLRANRQLPEWHYHIIDIEVMVAGYLMGQGIDVPLPYDSGYLSHEIGVLPEKFEAVKHTALGDCQWVKAQHEALLDRVKA